MNVLIREVPLYMEKVCDLHYKKAGFDIIKPVIGFPDLLLGEPQDHQPGDAGPDVQTQRARH